jgi:hypothetical protein
MSGTPLDPITVDDDVAPADEEAPDVTAAPEEAPVVTTAPEEASVVTAALEVAQVLALGHVASIKRKTPENADEVRFAAHKAEEFWLAQKTIADLKYEKKQRRKLQNKVRELQDRYMNEREMVKILEWFLVPLAHFSPASPYYLGLQLAQIVEQLLDNDDRQGYHCTIPWDGFVMNEPKMNAHRLLFLVLWKGTFF